MFYSILPTRPPTFAVQPDSPDLSDARSVELLARLEQHFMMPVVLISWDATGKFRRHGPAIAEELVCDEDLIWREFSLPVESDVPF